jgi:2-polyprenyl-3-methyl-5-hydroxy-6-metoxy-1,4-benzoquinol methylase
MPHIQTEQHLTSTRPCNLCGHSDVTVLSKRSRNATALQTVICKHCGLVWSDPFPHDPRRFYESDYRLEYKQAYSPKAKHIVRAGRVALERYGKIKHLLNGPKTVLDVGTGGGEFAYLIKSLGHDLYGIEPNKGYAEYSIAEYALNLQIGFIQDNTFNPASFDVITIWHVLEHTEDPYTVLHTLQGLLKPEGILVVEVPNIEASCQSPKSTFHAAHLYNFNLATLQKLGEKAGLKVEAHLFSGDAGNLTLFFRKAAKVNNLVDNWHIANNAEHITSLIHQHTDLKHFLTVKPYHRFLGRIYRTITEKRLLQSLDNKQKLLDQMFKKIPGALAKSI